MALKAIRDHGSDAPSVLVSAVAKAKENGSDHATPKLMKVKEPKAAASAKAKKADESVSRGLDFIKTNGLEGDERFFELLAVISGKSIDSLRKVSEKLEETV